MACPRDLRTLVNPRQRVPGRSFQQNHRKNGVVLSRLARHEIVVARAIKGLMLLR